MGADGVSGEEFRVLSERTEASTTLGSEWQMPAATNKKRKMKAKKI